MKPTRPDLYARAVKKVKARVARWPSAYASGQVVQEYKRLVAQTYGPKAKAYVGKSRRATAPLTAWFNERWVDILTGQPCGSVKTSSYYPTCRPQNVARRLTLTHVVDAVQRKQRAKKRTASYPSYFKKLR
jgi:hypothetical protein